MAERVLTIRLRTKADGTVEIEKVATALDRVGKEGSDAAKGADKASRSMSNVSGTASAAATAVKAFIGAWAVKEVVGGMASLVRTGIEYNSVLEQSRLGIASLVSAFGEIVDANGKRIEGEAAWQASLAISEDMQERLKIKALQTTAEYEDLVQALQFSVGPALQAAFDPNQIVDFTTAVAQSAAAIGIPMQQLGQEVRSLFQGDIGPDSRLAQMFFSGQKNVRAFVQELKDSGKFYDFMMEKMGAFTKAGEAMSGTFAGALSNLKDAFKQALGSATENALEGSTSALLELTGAIVTFDSEGRATFDSDFVDAVDAVASAFVGLGTAGVGAVKAFTDPGGVNDTMRAWVEEIRRDIEPAIDGLISKLDSLGEAWRRSLTETDPKSEKARYFAADFTQRGMPVPEDFGQRPEDQFIMSGNYIVPGPRNDPFVVAFNYWKEKIFGGAGGQGSLAGDRSAQDFYGGFFEEVVPPAEVFGPPAPKSSVRGTGGGGAGGESSAAAKLAEQTEDYLRWWEDLSAEAEAKGDPLQEALAKIEKDRRAALDKMEDANKKLKGALGGPTAEDINAIYDKKAIEAFEADTQKTVDMVLKAIGETYDEMAKRQAKFAEESAATEELRAAITADVEAERIALITDTIERAKQEQLLANEVWAAEEEARIKKSIESATERAEQLALIEERRAQKEKQINERAERLRREQMVGTAEFAKRVEREIAATFVSTADAIASAMIETSQAMRGAFDDMFASLFSGDGDLTDVFEGFTEQLQKIWSQRISDMFTKAIVQGESLGSQFKGIWDSMKPGGAEGAMAGAGVGAMVGGIFGKEGTYGDLGGMIGGGIGGIFGPVFGMLGSLFGTLIGSLIKKSQDWIRVAIVDGVVNVTEKGIDREARLEMQAEIQKTLEGLEDQYADILELFPEAVREQITAAVGKINAGDTVKGDDITNDAALLMFSDFLGEELPEKVFEAYSGAIEQGLELLGHDAARIQALMAHWGTLTGEELRKAIYDYVDVVTDTLELQDLYGGTFSGLQDEAARRNALTAFDPIRQLNADMAEATAELAGLDLDEQTAAMARINDMRRQGLEMEIQLLQAIHQMETALLQAGEDFRDRIEFQKLGDDLEAQVDFYEQAFNETMMALNEATDPAEIQRLYQRAMGYMQAAFGLAPDDALLQQDLLDSSRLLDETMRERTAAAIDEAAALELEAAQTLLDAGEILLEAGELLGGGPGAGPGGGGGAGGGGGGGGGIRDGDIGMNSAEQTYAMQFREIATAIREANARPINIMLSGEIGPLLEMIQVTATEVASRGDQALLNRIRRDPDSTRTYFS